MADNTTPDYLNLFNQMQSNYNSQSIDQRLGDRGFVKGYDEGGNASWSPGEDSYANPFVSNVIKGWGDDTSAADRNSSASAWNPRDFVNKYKVLPLDSAQFNGNTNYTEDTAHAQGFGSLNDFLSALDGGNGGKTIDVPGMGRVFVPGNPDTFDWTKDFTSAKPRGGVNGFGDSGGVVKLIASAITGGAAAGAFGGIEGAGALAGGDGAFLGAYGDLAGGAASSLGGGSFLAANDLAMGGAGTLGVGGYTAGAGAESLASLGGAGGEFGASLFGGGADTLGAGSLSAGDFGSSLFGTGSAMDFPTINPFSFAGADGTGGFSPNGGGSVFGQNTTPDWVNSGSGGSSVSTGGGGNPTYGSQALSDGSSIPTTAQSGVNIDWGQIAQKYGMDGAKALLNYVQNQEVSKDAAAASQNANALNDPRRAAFLNEANQIAQGNLGAGGTAIMNAVKAQADARMAKYGYGGTETSRADTALAAAMASYGNDRLNALLGYTGANQNNAATAYQATRDSLALRTQGMQGFTALASKIATDPSVGAAILTWFS